MTVSVSCVLEDSASGVDGISAAFAVLSEALSVFSAFEASFSGAASVTVLFSAACSSSASDAAFSFSFATAAYIPAYLLQEARSHRCLLQHGHGSVRPVRKPSDL